MLIGREKELTYLEEYFSKTGTQLLVVYGREGIGKTTLLKQFMEEKENFYYEAQCCSTRQQQFFCANQLNDMGYSFTPYPEFTDVFHVLDQETGGKRILVIDEFHNMCKTDTLFFEQLYQFLTGEEKQKDWFVVLCSSSIGWVENTMISKLGALSRLLTGFYKIKELKFKDLQTFFPGFSKEDCIYTYSIFGGIPGLWECFNDNDSLKENIMNSILSSKSILYLYGQKYVEEELRETAVYNTILASLASGKRKLNELHIHTGFSRAKISVYLKNLMQLEIVEKVFSTDTEGRNHTQKGIYQIRHNFVHFYYKFIFGNQSYLDFLGKEQFYETFIKPSLRDFAAGCFIQVCKEFLEQENLLGRLPGKYTKAGQWIGKTGNIDLVLEDEEEGNVLVGICNWTQDIMGYESYEAFKINQEKAKLEADYEILFSVSDFDDRLKDEAKKNPRLALLNLEQLGMN